MMIGLSFLFSVCHFVFFSFPTWSPWMLGLASQGSSTEWPATEETGEATRAGGTAIFIYSLFSFNFENLLIRGKIIVSVWFQRGTTNLPIWHIWLTHESHFPPKFHQQLPKPPKVKKSYSFCPNPK